MADGLGGPTVEDAEGGGERKGEIEGEREAGVVITDRADQVPHLPGRVELALGPRPVVRVA